MVACFAQLSPRRQETLLYMAVSVLTANTVNAVLGEWGFYTADMSELVANHPYHTLITYGKPVGNFGRAPWIIQFYSSLFRHSAGHRDRRCAGFSRLPAGLLFHADGTEEEQEEVEGAPRTGFRHWVYHSKGKKQRKFLFQNKVPTYFIVQDSRDQPRHER